MQNVAAVKNICMPEGGGSSFPGQSMMLTGLNANVIM